MHPPVRRVVVVGGGLAAHMTAAALARHFFDALEVTLVRCEEAPAADAWYGSVTAPSAYAFNLAIGVSEPHVMMKTSTTFSWGTRYAQWGAGARSWVQCFQLPLPIIGGVLFHHYLARLGVHDLQPYLPSAVAAARGAFVHPTEKAGPLLARAEYGYQLDAASYQGAFAALVAASKIPLIASTVAHVERGDAGITGIRLADGRTLTADLFVDCTGPEGTLISRLDAGFVGGRHLRGATTFQASDHVGPPHRTVTAVQSGWRAETSLQGGVSTFSVRDPESRAFDAHDGAQARISEVTLGRRSVAWSGNCVAIGQAACVLEPLSPAPMQLLQRDVERLLALIPLSHDMAVERREFNRQADEDQTHAALFNRALIDARPASDAPYWRLASAEPMHEKLTRKIAQFESRGLLVAYDLELFAPEDWTILHYGMGRRPARHDRVADRAAEAEIRQYLSGLQRDIENLVRSMPSHAQYMAGLIQYLSRQRR